MATITLSLPDEFKEAKEKFPETDWNEVLKRGILKRLEEVKKFELLKDRGLLEQDKFNELIKRGEL